MASSNDASSQPWLLDEDAGGYVLEPTEGAGDEEGGLVEEDLLYPGYKADEEGVICRDPAVIPYNAVRGGTETDSNITEGYNNQLDQEYWIKNCKYMRLTLSNMTKKNAKSAKKIRTSLFAKTKE
jgi:hypothetical protein